MVKETSFISEELKTLQEYLDWKYPTKEDKERVIEIDIKSIQEELESLGKNKELKGGDLDLREFKQLVRLNVSGNYLRKGIKSISLKTRTQSGSPSLLEEIYVSLNELTSLDLSGCPFLKKLDLNSNKLSNMGEVLDSIHSPDKLEVLDVSFNEIDANIRIFDRFVNLENLYINGNRLSVSVNSFSSVLTNLTKLDKSQLLTQIQSQLPPK